MVTNVSEPVTSTTVEYGTTSQYIAPFWEWEFYDKKVVTKLVNGPHTMGSEHQTWSAESPQLVSGPANKADSGYTYRLYKHVITYIVKKTNRRAEIQVTIKSTSTMTQTLPEPGASLKTKQLVSLNNVVPAKETGRAELQKRPETVGQQDLQGSAETGVPPPEKGGAPAQPVAENKAGAEFGNPQGQPQPAAGKIGEEVPTVEESEIAQEYPPVRPYAGEAAVPASPLAPPSAAKVTQAVKGPDGEEIVYEVKGEEMVYESKG
ncbi:uncharacterized protein KY384_008059 [Bacidia gigantensis]|uniref:uncharacterized protein n=1 Tax=Bacidia gigantensis TaxID=2732470 RepID=UPI001D0556D2|nr:uncharacterized protein KY384_008059 [Bacidia gigantensis]KAG8527315.1 hypothetical protein KY384_008059 [Bacidia gigantensis]